MENYFNYFTEIEEYFWQKRGAHLLVSTLDWAVIESWQRQGVPLEAVLKGIDRAFERWSRRAGRPGRIKSLLYCVDAVADVVEEMREAAAGRLPEGQLPVALPGFSGEEIARYLRENAADLRRAAERVPVSGVTFAEIAAALDALAEQAAATSPASLEDLEQHLTVFEEKVLAALTQAATADELVALRREVARALAPYRRKMKPEQIALVEKQYLQKKLFESHGLPRLSLFYLPARLAPQPDAPTP